VPLEIILELSTLPDKDVIIKRLQESKAPPPQLIALEEKMAKLELLLKASKVDQQISGTEKTRAEALKLLAEIGLPPNALSGVFPIHYREPSTVDRLLLTAGAEADMQQQEPPQNPMMQSGPDGAQGQPNGSPMASQGQPALPGAEPQFDEVGGLPMGPGVQ